MNSKIPHDDQGTPAVMPSSAVQRARPLFPLGAVVATPGALDLLDRNGINATTYLTRHQSGDFGAIDAADVQANLFAADHGLRILSAYDIGQNRLWILTEADRSATTLLLPSEY
jgi:hypothetical protein